VRPEKDEIERGEPSDPYIDCLFVVSRLLREHIFSTFGDDELFSLGKEVHLPRNDNGEVCFPEDGRSPESWNKLLLDRVQHRLFSFDLDYRGRNLMERITVIKTFWDISTNLRARRFEQILEDVEERLEEEQNKNQKGNQSTT